MHRIYIIGRLIYYYISFYKLFVYNRLLIIHTLFNLINHNHHFIDYYIIIIIFSITTLIDWTQISTNLLPRIKKYNELWLYNNQNNTNKTDNNIDMVQNNRFLKGCLHKSNQNNDKINDHNDNNKQYDTNMIHNDNENLLYDYITSRLNLSIHNEMSSQSTINTLKYMFYHMKCGIYVMIRNNKVVIFCPFVNKDYKNSWNNVLKYNSIDNSLESYYDEKLNHYRKEHIIKNTSEW